MKHSAFQKSTCLPASFDYNAVSDENNLNCCDASDGTDEFCKEFESSIEQLISKNTSYLSLDLTLHKSDKEVSNIARISNELKPTSEFLSEQSEVTKVEVDQNDLLSTSKNSVSVTDLADTYCMEKNAPESTPAEYLFIGSQEEESSSSNLKRVLKGDITGEPVYEIASDNNNNVQDKLKLAIEVSLLKYWAKLQKFTEKYPIYTAEEIRRQNLAFGNLKTRLENETVKEGLKVTGKLVHKVLVRLYNFGKMVYRRMLKKLLQYSIAHLDEFEDTDYQEIFNFAKMRTLRTKESLKSSLNYRLWMHSANEAALIPVSA
ncbi:unnamed protein product [Kluyveromyces dobzhanskii CBS 2104]|nr:unnamed protein product [Kluyveromyces dobzhanskii CBS 2104]